MSDRQGTWIPFIQTVVGCVVGGLVVIVGNYVVQERLLDHQRQDRLFQRDYQREERTVDRRLEAYATFDGLSMSLWEVFLRGGEYDADQASRLNSALSLIAILSSDATRLAAADVHLVIAKLKAASSEERKAILDGDLLSYARVAFRRAVQNELNLRSVAEEAVSNGL